MAEQKPASFLAKCGSLLRGAVALVGTIPMTVLLLTALLRALCSPPVAEALAAVLFFPCWLTALCLAWVAPRGVTLAAWVAAISAASWLALRVVG